jgi:hypothetical protein
MCECQRGGVLFNEIVPLQARIAEMTEHFVRSHKMEPDSRIQNK